MAGLRQIPRTAAFAWSTSIAKPLVATGTRAGAVDADFSDETKLEIWDLDSSGDEDVKPLASITSDARYANSPASSEMLVSSNGSDRHITVRFYDIAWSQPNPEHPEGIIAGALENGALDLWDAAKLKANVEYAVTLKT